MKTIAACTTDETASQVEEISEQESRAVGEVAATALDLYTALPSSARKTLREFLTSEDPRLREQSIARITRSLLNLRWEMLNLRIAQEQKERSTLPEGDMDEEEIGKLAVEIVSRRGTPDRTDSVCCSFPGSGVP